LPPGRERPGCRMAKAAARPQSQTSTNNGLQPIAALHHKGLKSPCWVHSARPQPRRGFIAWPPGRERLVRHWPSGQRDRFVWCAGAFTPWRDGNRTISMSDKTFSPSPRLLRQFGVRSQGGKPSARSPSPPLHLNHDASSSTLWKGGRAVRFLLASGACGLRPSVRPALAVPRYPEAAPISQRLQIGRCPELTVLKTVSLYRSFFSHCPVSLF
jgi:hypothetical protein